MKALIKDEIVQNLSDTEYPPFDGIEYKIIDASELPQDRTFRNAWEYA